MSLYPPQELLLALNAFPGITRISLRGRNAAISSAAETVWGPGATFAQMTSATALEAVSSSANDTSAGTGARTIIVRGLDSNYLPVTQTVTLNGVTPVALTTNLVAVNRVSVATAGSGLTNAGTIDVRTVSGSTIKKQISTGPTLGLGLDADFVFTIPSGYVGVLRKVSWSATLVTGDITVYLQTTTSTGTIQSTRGASKSSLSNTGFNTAIGEIDFGVGLILAAKDLLELRAIVSAGAGDLVAMADLILVNQSNALWGTGAASPLL